MVYRHRCLNLLCYQKALRIGYNLSFTEQEVLYVCKAVKTRVLRCSIVHETLNFVTLELATRRCLCQLLTARERLKLQAKETVCKPPVEKIQKLNQKRVEATPHPEDYMQYDNADEHKGSISICVRRRKCAMKKAEAAKRGSRLVWLEETTVEDDVDAEKLTRRLLRVTYSKHCIHTAFTDYLQCTLRARESAKHLPRHREIVVDQNEIPQRRE